MNVELRCLKIKMMITYNTILTLLNIKIFLRGPDKSPINHCHFAFLLTSILTQRKTGAAMIMLLRTPWWSGPSLVPELFDIRKYIVLNTCKIIKCEAVFQSRRYDI